MIKEQDNLLDEGRMPEPAPGKKVISFSLPGGEEKPGEAAARKRKAKEKEKEKNAQSGLTEADFAIFNAEDYKDLSASPRRRSREVALLLLFAVVGGNGWDLAANILSDTGIRGENAAFALDLAKNAFSSLEESDRILSSYARDWDVSRFSTVDRNILRLAVAELLGEDHAGHNIIINEAVELGKKFGSEESGAFINGMLDNIYSQEIKRRSEHKNAEDHPQ